MPEYCGGESGEYDDLLLFYSPDRQISLKNSTQIYRLRSAVVKVILAQEIGWHDTRTTDGLAVRISE